MLNLNPTYQSEVKAPSNKPAVSVSVLSSDLPDISRLQAKI